MFSVESSGWLCYEPFAHYRLPEIVFKPRIGKDSGENPGRADFVPAGSGKVAFTRLMYRLRWPGERDRAHDDRIPTTIVQHWPNALSRQLQEDIKNREKGAFEPIPLTCILEQRMLPPDDQIPEAITYHLAVNHKLYFKDEGIQKGGVQFPVAGLPARRVQQILDSTFALDEKALAALTYLKWLAEGHRPHPLLRSFDTNIRESLLGIAQEAARLFFYLIYDYQYSEETQWWARGDQGLNYRIPLYLHWIGRTGMGLYQDHAGIPPEDTSLCNNMSWDVLYPDVLDQLKRWDMDRMRNYMQDDGGVTEIPIEKGSRESPSG